MDNPKNYDFSFMALYMIAHRVSGMHDHTKDWLEVDTESPKTPSTSDVLPVLLALQEQLSDLSIAVDRSIEACQKEIRDEFHRRKSLERGAIAAGIDPNDKKKPLKNISTLQTHFQKVVIICKNLITQIG